MSYQKARTDYRFSCFFLTFPHVSPPLAFMTYFIFVVSRTFTCSLLSFVYAHGVNFINLKRTNFSYETSFRQLFSSDMYVKKLTFVQKICTFNVGEIDTCCQFHQHFTSSFYKCRSQKRKKTLMTSRLSLCAFGIICTRKSLSKTCW